MAATHGSQRGQTSDFLMGPNNRPKLKPADIELILQSKEPNQVLAAKFGVTRQAISLVRNGKSYTYIVPDLPRIPVRMKNSVRNVITCQDCTEWNGQECFFGFPEAIDEPNYAADCSLFRRNPDSP